MDGIKHSRQFAEMERLVSDYFHCHLAPVMSKTQAYLTKKQGEEMREYSTSLGGILSAMASAAQPMGDPYQVLKVTGEWNSKTTEDYIGDYRLQGDTARPRIHGRAMARYRRAGNRAQALR